MPVDATIALGLKPVQVKSQNEYMNELYTMRNAEQANQMNQMKMNEANRLQGVNARFSSDLSNLGDPNAPEYENNLRQAYIRKNDIPGYQAHVTADLANQKARGDIQKQKQEYAGSIARDLGRNSSDANTTAWFEDSMDSHVFSPEEKVKITNEYGKLMAMALPERKAYLLAQNASVAEAKPTTYQQDVGGSTNIVSVPAFGGAPTVLSSTEKTSTPEQQSKMPSGQAKLQKEYTEAEAGIKALLAKANSAKTEPERAQALADAKALSASNSLRGEEITRLQQSTQPLEAKDRRIKDYAQAIRDGRSPNDQDMKDLRLQIEHDRTHANQIRPPIDPRVVTHVTVKEDGTLVNQNALGQVVSTIKEGGKPGAQFAKTREQTKTLGKNLDLAIAELENATKDGGLIDQSTGSGLGKLANTARGFITGGASKGAIAGAKLAPIADLGLKMVPRFEGPQSDKDTQSYKEASGQLADTSIPNEIRKDAGRTVLRLLKARKGQFVTPEMAAQGEAPAGGIAPPAGFVAD